MRNDPIKRNVLNFQKWLIRKLLIKAKEPCVLVGTWKSDTKAKKTKICGKEAFFYPWLLIVMVLHLLKSDGCVYPKIAAQTKKKMHSNSRLCKHTRIISGKCPTIAPFVQIDVLQ